MLIRDATLADARRIAEIHVAAWREAYRGILPDEILDGLNVDKREVGWRRHLENKLERALVAEVDGRVVGWATFGRCKDEPDGTITDGEVFGIYLDPAYWRRGIGQALWRAAVAELSTAGGCRRVAVWVLSSNTRARAFYERLGGQIDDHSEKPFLRDGATVNQVRYWCPIPRDDVDA